MVSTPAAMLPTESRRRAKRNSGEGSRCDMTVTPLGSALRLGCGEPRVDYLWGNVSWSALPVRWFRICIPEPHT